MAYFKIGTTDFSNITSALSVSYKHKFKERDNALGNKTIDYINRKKVVSVEIIPITISQMNTIMGLLSSFSFSISVQEPGASALSTFTVKVEDYNISYYRIAGDNTLYNKISLTFQEL